MSKTILLSIVLGVLANDYIPPKPDNYPGDKWAWERAYKRCLEKPTKWARDQCIKKLYDN